MPVDRFCYCCCSRKGKNENRLKLLDIIQKKAEKVLSFETYVKITREVMLYRSLFLDEYQKSLLKVCQIPKINRNLKAPVIDGYYENNIEIILKNKNKTRRLNKKVLDSVCVENESFI